MKLTMYQYPQCSTCRKALAWLKKQGHEVEAIHIVEQPPRADQFRTWVEQSQLPLKSFFNVAGQVYRELQLKDRLSQMDEAEQFALLSSNGMLIKRPIVSDGKRVTVGFKEDIYEEAWGNS